MWGGYQEIEPQAWTISLVMVMELAGVASWLRPGIAANDILITRGSVSAELLRRQHRLTQ